LPTGLSLDLIHEIEPKVLIYYCIDSFQASSKDARKIRGTEKLVLRRADLVFVTSVELLNYCSQHNRRAHYFPFGVNIENFKRVLLGQADTPNDIKSVRKPIVGYIGGIHKWIDFDLVRYVAGKNAGLSFVFCGPVQTDITAIKDLPNVNLLGMKKTEELPRYVGEFDIAIIPYRITDYTKNVYPTKLNEYLSMGKRVVSTDLPEIKKFNSENENIVMIAGSKEEFAHCIQQAAIRPFSDEEAAFAMRVAEKNSWSNKIAEMSRLIEDAEREKALLRETMWKGNLARFYKKTGRRLALAGAILTLVYVLFVYTPFIWFVASPLRIQDTPQKADAVVALGGGVGESGKVGQGYQERVDTAVKLYDQDFAKTILFSSGYKYIMKEAEVMKTLSVAMGVGAENILVDDDSTNTYEMIVHLKGLVEKTGWRNVILVSSPYHMLRLKLLSDKHLRGVHVMYVPVEKSSYYARSSGIKPHQVEGIVKEYLAILYYKFKGYI
ncbi:MAG: ElyC/SanA/YdcF family protein, partial [Candidatus Omnitrophota bacterium]